MAASPIAGAEAAPAIPLTVLRHGPTQWNQDRRLQGRTDVPLSAAGIAAVTAWASTGASGSWGQVAGALCLCSPLGRARQTAALLWPDRPVRLEPALIEMAWGRWEGQRLADIAQHGSAADRAWLAAAPVLARHFRPPGGESPALVAARLTPLLQRLAAAGRASLWVTHKGVIRALLSLATGWDMTRPWPERLRRQGLHRFALDRTGTLTLVALNT